MPPGVPPGGCDEGFTYDGNGGCDPILPATDCGEGEMAVPGDTGCYAVGAAGDPPTCPPGQVALPGETACHALADCGAAPWGNIPVEATTEYVDQSYEGGASDGTAARPWTTIGAAVTAAIPGAIIAVAAGSYPESVSVTYKAVRLWGRCPSMVEIAGTGEAAVTLGGATDGTEIHTIALTGAGAGASLGSASMVVVDAVWVHDTASYGVFSNGSDTLRGSLVERATNKGFELDSADISVGASVVRDTAPDGAGEYGWGMDVSAGSALTVTGSVIERNHDLQLAIYGSEATIDGCVIRDGIPNPGDVTFGDGVYATFEGRRAALTLRTSTLERNTNAAIALFGSDAVVEDALIRDTRSGASSALDGFGLSVESDPTANEPSSLTATRSLLERNRTVGALVAGGSLTLDHCVVRDTLPQESAGTGGLGVEAEQLTATAPRSSLTITGSLLERNRSVGLLVLGADGIVSSTLVRDTLPQQSDGTVGQGVDVEMDPTAMQNASLTLTGSVVTVDREAGVLAASADLVLDRSVVSSTRPSSVGYGIGVYAYALTGADAPRGTLTVTRALLANSRAAGLYVAGTDATISQTYIRGVVPADDGGGDGVVVDTDAVLTASSCRVENSARAGLSMFGTAQITMSRTTLACDAIPLDSEGQSSFTTGGDVICSCAGSTSACQVLSSNLQPPQPIAPPAP